ncbi:MAG: hypothetical protein KDD44_11775, partial [Bdellovibrionales bacterium]|nr:hypothetical protein [Bdellovibrionales bacterium]
HDVLAWCLGTLMMFSVASNAHAADVINSNFSQSADGFQYADDSFLQTAHPAYASGNYTATGGATGGGLETRVGGIDRVAISNGMSGGWSRTFNLAQADTVTVSVRYRLFHTLNFEPDECSEALLAIDSTLHGQAGQRYLHRFCGSPQIIDLDSGWQMFSFQTQLPAGQHTLTIGGFLNGKTTEREEATIWFDDVRVSIPGGTLQETICNDTIDNDSDTFTDCADSDCNGQNSCEFGTELSCSDGIDNDADAATDCSDSDCALSPACQPQTEAICNDLTDNDLDTHTDCADDDCDGIGSCEFQTELSCNDAFDNDADGVFDCSDSDCAAAPNCQQTGQVVFSATFDQNAEGFSYLDDAFMQTAHPAYESGVHAPGLGMQGAGLLLQIGGVDGSQITNGMSGAWVRTFTLSQPQTVRVSFAYRHFFTLNFEPDECGEVVVAVDGALQGQAPNQYVQRYCGVPAQIDQDTGWQTFSFDLALSAGQHLLQIGSYLN